MPLRTKQGLSTDFRVNSFASGDEFQAYKQIVNLMKQTPIPDSEILANLGLYIPRVALARILYLHTLYQKILNTTGIIVEFGTRWGNHLAVFETLRSIYEPHNHPRTIVGFDTFEGYLNVNEKDGKGENIRNGEYNVSLNYENYLNELLTAHEKLAPRPHLKKFEIIKGDVVKTFPAYLKDHPETVISLAYFDLNLYEPTKVCLELIRDRLPKGAIVAFDEIGHPDVPGETLAFFETWNISGIRLQHDPLATYQSYFVVE